MNNYKQASEVGKIVLQYGTEGNYGIFFADAIIIRRNTVTFKVRFRDGRKITLSRDLTDRELRYIYETDRMG